VKTHCEIVRVNEPLGGGIPQISLSSFDLQFRVETSSSRMRIIESGQTFISPLFSRKKKSKTFFLTKTIKKLQKSFHFQSGCVKYSTAIFFVTVSAWDAYYKHSSRLTPILGEMVTTKTSTSTFWSFYVKLTL
jgi:hypothetical protein